MADIASKLTVNESRAARRLTQLFRVERPERAARRSITAVWRLIRRRRRLLDELIRLEAERRSLAAPASPELNAAIAELAREANVSQEFCRARIEVLGDELRRRQGGGIATGLRDSATGRILGRG